MQIWFFFNPGVGGDGVANLFERSENVVSFDASESDSIDYWRVHRFVDNSPKFYAPTPDSNGCFRSGRRFCQTQNELHPGYVDCVSSGKNCVVASHDVWLQALAESDCQSIFSKDQVKVLLTVDDQYKADVSAATKNLKSKLIRSTYPAIDHSNFDFVLNVDRIQTDWEYVFEFSQAIGIDLRYQTYLEYQDLLKGNKTYMVNNFQVEEYVSCIHNEDISYKLVGVWQ